MTVTIQQGDSTFYCEGEYDEVCKAIVDGRPLTVFYFATDKAARITRCVTEKITFFSDVDWVSVEL